jgi:hypothetical protein
MLRWLPNHPEINFTENEDCMTIYGCVDAFENAAMKIGSIEEAAKEGGWGPLGKEGGGKKLNAPTLENNAKLMREWKKGERKVSAPATLYRKPYRTAPDNLALNPIIAPTNTLTCNIPLSLSPP